MKRICLLTLLLCLTWAGSALGQGVSTRPYSTVNRGAASVTTDGVGALGTGYSRIQPAIGSTTPAGVAIFGFRQGGILVSEAGVPASASFLSGRLYAEVLGNANTGVAIANPSSQTATITFHFTDSAGSDFGFGTTTIGANQQIANFLSEFPFNALTGRASAVGTFSFSSNVAVAVIALRLFVNERNEQLITTLPVTDLAAAAPGGILVMPHYTDGSGWTTQIVLVNPTDAAITGTVQFFTQGTFELGGVPATVTANGQSTSSFPYSIPRQSSFKIVTSGQSPGVLTGSIRLTSTNSTPVPSSLAIFSFKPAGITVAEAGVPGVSGTAFRMYVEETDALDNIGTVQTGFAIANLAPGPTIITLELMNLDGTSARPSATVNIPGNGQVARFLHEVFAGITYPFRGTLRISGSAAGLSVVGLRARYNERRDYLITTTPAVNENGTSSNAELFFPHLVNGGGYNTQFILFSGTLNQTSTGNLKFVKQDGTPLSLTVQ